jgi:isopentenyl-diphosphate delta-isomerase
VKPVERVVLVDEADRAIGTEEKMAAHKGGLLHRAFSICVSNRSGAWLLQRRSATKYHSGGQWSNTCCGHPRPGERLDAAAHRRLREEMGFDCPLRRVSMLHYSARLDHGLVENEVDHVLWGEYDDDPDPDPTEAEEWSWVSPASLRERIAERPAEFTPWFKLLFHAAWSERGWAAAPWGAPRLGI